MNNLTHQPHFLSPEATTLNFVNFVWGGGFLTIKYLNKIVIAISILILLSIREEDLRCFTEF